MIFLWFEKERIKYIIEIGLCAQKSVNLILMMSFQQISDLSSLVNNLPGKL